MSDFRNEFPVTREWAYLNHAAVAPLSRRAHDRILAWAADVTNHGNVREAEWYREVEAVRASSARLINASPDEIAFLKNTSEGLALVAEGLDLKAGDSVVAIGREFPANVYPWLQLQSRGVDVRAVPPGDRGRVSADDIAAAIDGTTRLLSISFVQYASGFRSDLAALGGLCRERGVMFCVDAIQGLGVHPLDVAAMQIDFLAADGHKWLVSPEGAAIFYCRRELLERLRPVSVGWKSVANYGNFAQVDFRWAPTAARFECGSLNVAGIVALGASLELFEEVGIAEIERRVFDVTELLVQRLAAAGASVYSSRLAGEWSGIVSFEWPDGDSKRLKLQCLKRNVMISYRDGRLRASPHFYNNASDIDALLDALESA
ncbi:MAG: aminotransferase class V-fold PLP-dependent enzyme [Planctomycetaceae bacterium]|nr:aminotransferase class V-fold PLP-dependent enzyme [Planctomycetaceae bacterium]